MTNGKIGNIDLVKQLNCAAVYRVIDEEASISRIKIAETLGLAQASITKITRQLIQRGLVKEVAQQASTGGRPAISLTTNVDHFHCIAVRLGRKSITLGYFDLAGNLQTTTTEAFYYQDQQDLVKKLTEKISHFIETYSVRCPVQMLEKQPEQNAKQSELIAIGITLPGLVNPIQGVVDHMPNINVVNLKLAEVISRAFSVPCYIGNDIRSLALAEYYFGASKHYHDSILISVHNGTGAGIIVNDRVFLGHNYNVGEIGHIQIDPLGKQCQCGNYGCLETIASNPAIIEQIETLLQQGHPSLLADEDVITISKICDAALQDDLIAKQTLINVSQQLGKAIAMSVNLFNPQLVILYGEITKAQSLIFPIIAQCLEKQTLTRFNQQLSVVKAELNEKPIYGAFAIVKDALLNGRLLLELIQENAA